MSDTTKKEKLFYKNNSLWGHRDATDVDEDINQVYCRRSFLLSPGVFAIAWPTCTNCWSMGIGAEYALFLHRNATINHLRDHSVSSTRHCECGLATGGSCAYSFRQILRSTD